MRGDETNVPVLSARRLLAERRPAHAARALAGAANGSYVFCVPGSSGACATAWDDLIEAQLDYRTRPCNLVELMPRLQEK